MLEGNYLISYLQNKYGRVTTTGANQESEEAAGNFRTGDDHRSRGRGRD